MSALTSLLARDQVVAVRKIEEALQKQVVAGGDIASVLLELDAISENTLAAYAAALHGRLPATRDEVMRAPRDVVRVVPREVAEKHRLVPVALDGPTLIVALSVPLSEGLEQQLSFLLGHTLVSRVVCEARIAAALSHHYGVEPTPRMRRLIERLREREAGTVPYVAPPETGKVSAQALDALPNKRRSAASFLDDSEEDDEVAEPAPKATSNLRPSGLPPEESRTTDPLGYVRPRVGDGAGSIPPRSEPPPPVKTQPPPRRVSVPPPSSVNPPAASAEPVRPAVVPAAPAPAAVPRESLKAAAVESSRALRRLFGPMSASQAVQLLEEAQKRDDVVEVLFAFARQFFDFAAAFSISGDVAEGRDAHGAGASDADVRRMTIELGTPSAPRGMLGEARARLAPVAGNFDRTDEDRGVARRLGQSLKSAAIAVPIALRGRAVLLVVGVRSGAAFAVSDVPELVAFVPRVVQAIERIILKKKRASGGFASVDSPAVRADLKAAVHGARSSTAPRARERSADRWGSIGSSPAQNQVASGTETVTGTPAPITREPLRPVGPAEERGSLAEAILAGTDEGLPASRPASDPAPPAPLPRASGKASSTGTSQTSPRVLLGIPRTAPPPPTDASFLLPVVSLPPRDTASRTTVNLTSHLVEPAPTLPPSSGSGSSGSGSSGSGSSPMARSATGSAADDDEPELSVSGSPEDDGDEPELSVDRTDPGGDWDDEDWADGGEANETLADATVADGALADDAPETASTSRRTEPSPPPVTSVPPAALISPTPVDPEISSYSMQDVAEEVVIPLRTRRSSNTPSMPARTSIPSRSFPPHSEAASKDARREEGSQPPPSEERIAVRAIERATSNPPASSESGRASLADRAASRDVPSVIVDMGDAVENLVVDLQHAGPDDERAAVNALLRLGEAALPVLAQTFPGPLWFDRHRPHRRAPRGRDVCAIARAFYAFGVRATPYVATLTSSSSAEKRYYALLVAGDMVHPSLTDAVLARVFDEDESIRKLAHEIAPRFRGIAGWDEQLTLIRRAARIRGKDPMKRLHALTALAALRDGGALRMLVELLEDDDRDVVRHAHLTLVALTAEDLGPSPRKWTAWADKNANRHRVEWLIDALTHSDEALRIAAGDELKQLTQQYFGFHPSTTRREREVAQSKYRQWWSTEGKKQFS